MSLKRLSNESRGALLYSLLGTLWVFAMESGLRQLDVEPGTHSMLDTGAILAGVALGGALVYALMRVQANAQRAAALAIARSDDRLSTTLDLLRISTWDYDCRTGAVGLSRLHDGLHGLEWQPGFNEARYEAAILPEDWPRVRAAFAGPVVADRWVEVEYRVRWPDGSLHWLWCSGVVTSRDESGTPLFVHGILSDITARKESEAQVAQLNAELEVRGRDLERRVAERTGELEAANRALDCVAPVLAHDLRTPLRSVEGHAAALLRTLSASSDPRTTASAQRIMQGVERALSMLDGLLELARLRQAPMRNTRVDLAALAREILEDLRARGDHRPMEVVLPPSLVVQGDPALLRVALQNLLQNACKFSGTRACPRIEFGVVASKTGAREIGPPGAFYVRDNGVGFDPEYGHKLFTPFQRLHSATEFQGMGLGLATVERIVLRHGGRIWADSRPGMGATFAFTLAGAPRLADQAALSGNPEGALQ